MIRILIHRRSLTPWQLVITLIASRRVSVIMIVPLIILVVPLIIRVTTLEIGIAILPLVLVMVKVDTVTVLVRWLDLFLIRAHFRGCAVF